MERIIVFLNGERGIAVLRAIAAAGHGIIAAVVPPVEKTIDAISKAVEGYSVRTWPVADVNGDTFAGQCRLLSPRLGLIAGFSTILRKTIYALPELGTINLHAGRVPQYRGGSPLNWQLIMGERRAGLSVLQVDDGIDSGDILAEAEIPIESETTIADLHARANEIFPSLVLRVLGAFDDGEYRGRAQNAAQASYWHQRNDEDGHLDFTRLTVDEALRMTRALTTPYRGAHAMCNGRLVRILEASRAEFPLRGSPGRICWIQNNGPYVVLRDGALLVREYSVEDEAAWKVPHGAYFR